MNDNDRHLLNIVAFLAIVLLFIGTIIGVYIYVYCRREDAKKAARTQALRAAMQKRQEVVVKVRPIFSGLRRPFDGPLNDRQVLILVALTEARPLGLTLSNILDLWGWDGSKLDFVKFAVDWCGLWHTPRLFEDRGFGVSKTMVDGPHDSDGVRMSVGDPPNLDGIYKIRTPGLEYLAENILK